MNIKISSKNVALSHYFKKMLTEKLEHQKKYFDKIMHIDVYIEKSIKSDMHCISLKIGIPKNKPVMIHACDSNLYAIANTISCKMMNALSSLKEKKKKIKKERINLEM